MKHMAETIAALTESKEVGLILSILEAGFGRLTEATNEAETKVTTVKINMPMLNDPKIMVYSVLKSSQKVMRDLYQTEGILEVCQGFDEWKRRVKPMSEFSDELILEALYDPDLGGLYALERESFLADKGGVDPAWLKKMLATIAKDRKLITKKKYRKLIK